MNTLFGDMAERLAAFNPEEEALLSAKRNRLKIIRLNRDDQMFEQGIDARGDKIGRGYYKKPTQDYKEAVGQRYDHITLRDTQAFHKSMDVRFSKTEFEITADDRKESDLPGGADVFLTEIYGEDILGLTKENLSFLKEEHIRPDMTRKLRDQLLGAKIK